MNVIWCEISCGRCGAAIGDYYSPDWIKKLKAMSKDWTHDDNYRVLCPQCRKELKKNETKFSYRMKGANNMNDILEQRLSAKKRDLENQQEYFRIDMKNIEQSNYEDNAINALLYMKKLKTEIAELELVMQLKKTNEI